MSRRKKAKEPYSSMASKNPSFFLLPLLLLSLLTLTSSFSPHFLVNPTSYLSSTPPDDSWTLLHKSIGVSAMHMQLLHDNKVVIFDRTDFGPSNLSLPNGRCRHDPHDTALKVDCTAHSLLYDVPSNTFRPLMVQTDTWCSSGSVVPDGSLIQTGGYGDGERVVRTFTPCPSTNQYCDWNELPKYLSERRWYASNQLLPDGRVIVVGGRAVFTYEFFPKNANAGVLTSYYLKFLKDTKDYKEENNLYPFLHLLPDGNLFIFANTRSISFDYVHNRVVREFPAIPGEKRNYPSTGSSVLLPLKLTGTAGGLLPAAEVMVCGGAPPGAFLKAQMGVYVTAAKSCGRIRVSDPDPNWVMEDMPIPRVMSDMLLLPTGDVILINGARNGTAGWEYGVDPVLNPVIYTSSEPDPNRRFVVLSPSTIPRMYHSSAVLLADGRILVGGSNPHRVYNFTAYPYPTELSLEAFSPPYLVAQYGYMRPSILTVESADKVVSYGQIFSVTFAVSVYRPELGVEVTMVMPSFTTHSFAMNQRALNLNVVRLDQLSVFAYKVVLSGPTTSTVAPPGYYMLFVVHGGIPSHGVWVKVQ